jgi:hypothetical protein
MPCPLSGRILAAEATGRQSARRSLSNTDTWAWVLPYAPRFKARKVAATGAAAWTNKGAIEPAGYGWRAGTGKPRRALRTCSDPAAPAKASSVHAVLLNNGLSAVHGQAVQTTHAITSNLSPLSRDFLTQLLVGTVAQPAHAPRPQGGAHRTLRLGQVQTVAKTTALRQCVKLRIVLPELRPG